MKHFNILLMLVFLNAEIAFAGWRTSFEKDKMTGESSGYAILDAIKADVQLEFPYADLTSFIGIGCTKESEWVYIGFNLPPNLTNGETRDKYDIIVNRVKYDNRLSSESFTQEWGAKFLHAQDTEGVIKRISESKTFLVAYKWYGVGDVYFTYPVKGASAAIKEVRKRCK